uniref:G-protein coupled receptors family 1 profile domain-containing protein n=1 Tax=Plectus sambesii TaxID=2011161 RepID=A0A914V631_9BILA
MMTTNSTGLYVEATTLSEAIEVEIERLRPLTDTPTSYTMVLCAVLLVSLIFGIGGNASLFGLIVYVRKWVDRAPPEQTSPPPANFTTPCIMLLCLVNLAISVSVAPVIVDYLVGLWLLGEGVCTFYKTVTAGGNIMANFAVAGIAY